MAKGGTPLMEMTETIPQSAIHRDGAFQGALYHVDGARYAGYAVNLGDPEIRYVVDILIDGWPLCSMRANEFVTSLARSSIGDGCYGFSLNLNQGVLNFAHTIEARVSNTGQLVGMPSALGETLQRENPPLEEYIEWHRSLHFSGWSSALNQPGTRLRVLVDNIDVLDAEASGWKAIGRSVENASAVPAFQFHLPERFADGKIRSLTIEDQSGRQLTGSPIQFLAYGDDLEDAIELLTGAENALFRTKAVRLRFPQSWPLSRYDDWLRRIRKQQKPSLPCSREIAVVVAGNEGIDDTLTSLKNTDGRWIVASLPTDPANDRFDVASLRRFLTGEAAHCSTIVFSRAGTTFAADCLGRIDGLFESIPEALLAYGDLSVRSDDRSCWPIAFPAFDYERFLEQGYLCNLFASRREEILTRIPEGGVADLFEVAFTLVSGPEAGPDIFHLPGECGILPVKDALGSSRALAGAVGRHLEMRGCVAVVQPQDKIMFPAVRVRRALPAYSTEIIIPTRNRTDLLRGCIDSIAAGAARVDAKITVIDNDSDLPDTKAYLASLEVRNFKVLRIPGEFNFSKLNNRAVAQSNADVVCLLNNDIEAIDDVWLEELLSRLAESDVGAVGALLCTPRGIVQHGGVVLGGQLIADHAFCDRVFGDPGYTDLLKVAHQCSAVTAACLATIREDYLKVGGLDEIRFPIDFNDVDYCLKLRSRGRRVVFTPHARLVHLESASRENLTTVSRILHRAISNLSGSWPEVLEDDPFYSPVLALDGVPYSGLAWPQRDLSPRTSNGSAPIVVSPGM